MPCKQLSEAAGWPNNRLAKAKHLATINRLLTAPQRPADAWDREAAGSSTRMKSINSYSGSRRRQSVDRTQAHVRGHHEVLTNELWYRDHPPDLGKGFSAAETKERSDAAKQILLRAAKKAETRGLNKVAASLIALADKLAACRPRRRCGSLACPLCARAFQKAKVAAQTAALTNLQSQRSGKLVFVTIIPRTMMYAPNQLAGIDVKKANRWLKDALKAIGKRVMLGSVDFSWERRRGERYRQLHWHLAMWTRHPARLQKKLKAIFAGTRKYERPVDVKIASANAD